MLPRCSLVLSPVLPPCSLVALSLLSRCSPSATSYSLAVCTDGRVLASLNERVNSARIERWGSSFSMEIALHYFLLIMHRHVQCSIKLHGFIKICAGYRRVHPSTDHPAQPTSAKPYKTIFIADMYLHDCIFGNCGTVAIPNTWTHHLVRMLSTIPIIASSIVHCCFHGILSGSLNFLIQFVSNVRCACTRGGIHLLNTAR